MEPLTRIMTICNQDCYRSLENRPYQKGKWVNADGYACRIETFTDYREDFVDDLITNTVACVDDILNKLKGDV